MFCGILGASSLRNTEPVLFSVRNTEAKLLLLYYYFEIVRLMRNAVLVHGLSGLFWSTYECWDDCFVQRWNVLKVVLETLKWILSMAYFEPERLTDGQIVFVSVWADALPIDGNLDWYFWALSLVGEPLIILDGLNKCQWLERCQYTASVLLFVIQTICKYGSEGMILVTLLWPVIIIYFLLVEVLIEWVGKTAQFWLAMCLNVQLIGVIVPMEFYFERLACVHWHRAYLSHRTWSVRLLFCSNVEYNVPNLLGKIINEIGVKPICQSIYRTICWSIYRHKLMAGIIMVRCITIYEVPLECLPFGQCRGRFGSQTTECSCHWSEKYLILVCHLTPFWEMSWYSV